MSYGLNRTPQTCIVKIESGLGYKSSQVRVQVRVQQKWTEVRTRVQVRTQVLQVWVDRACGKISAKLAVILC